MKYKAKYQLLFFALFFVCSFCNVIFQQKQYTVIENVEDIQEAKHEIYFSIHNFASNNRGSIIISELKVLNFNYCHFNKFKYLLINQHFIPPEFI